MLFKAYSPVYDNRYIQCRHMKISDFQTLTMRNLCIVTTSITIMENRKKLPFCPIKIAQNTFVLKKLFFSKISNFLIENGNFQKSGNHCLVIFQRPIVGEFGDPGIPKPELKIVIALTQDRTYYLYYRTVV